jgi:two-component system, chemotaxis family, chemotaxis protein CheY
VGTLHLYDDGGYLLEFDWTMNTLQEDAFLNLAPAAAMDPPAAPITRLNILIVEDDFASRLLLKKLLGRVGECHSAADGEEGVTKFTAALTAGTPYDLVCLDIMLPKLDGQLVLQEMRKLEAQRGVVSSRGAKILMVTAMVDMKNVMAAYRSLCDGYLSKPVTGAALNQALQELGFSKPA